MNATCVSLHRFSVVCILAGYSCDKADEWRLHWVVGPKLAVQLKHSFLIWCVGRTFHENPPERCKEEKKLETCCCRLVSCTSTMQISRSTIGVHERKEMSHWARAEEKAFLWKVAPSCAEAWRQRWGHWNVVHIHILLTKSGVLYSGSRILIIHYLMNRKRVRSTGMWHMLLLTHRLKSPVVHLIQEVIDMKRNVAWVFIWLHA